MNISSETWATIIMAVFIILFFLFRVVRLRKLKERKEAEHIFEVQSDQFWPIVSIILFSYELYFDRSARNEVDTALLILMLSQFVYAEYIRPEPTTITLSQSGYRSKKGWLIKRKKLTHFEVSENELVIHSKKYRNHEVLKKKKLVKPEWNEVIETFKKYAQKHDHIELIDHTAEEQSILANT